MTGEKRGLEFRTVVEWPFFTTALGKHFGGLPTKQKQEAIDRITDAMLQVIDAHEGKKRESGGPYIEGHDLPVTYFYMQLADMAGITKAEQPMGIQASLLHDVIENPTDKRLRDKYRARIAQNYHPDVVKIVEALTKRPYDDFAGGKKLQRIARTQAHLQAIAELPEELRRHALLIKLADRIHNILTLQYSTPGKQTRYSRETRDVFLPFFRTHLGDELTGHLEHALSLHVNRRALGTMLKQKAPAKRPTKRL